MVEVIVFDFDNTLALNPKTGEGSEEIKDQAWYKVFPEHEPDILTPILESSKKRIVGGKGDRKDIARDVLLHFGHNDQNLDAEVLARCDAFNQVVQEGINAINISPEVRASLQSISELFPLFINTATPEENIKESLEALGIAKFFTKVYGRPGNKVSNLEAIISNTKLAPQQIMFVDDSQAGYEAAVKVGCQFIGIRTKRNKLWNENPQPFQIINSITELISLLT